MTLLSNDSYFDGVVALYKSILHTNTLYPFVCLLSLSISIDIEDKLRNRGVICIRLNESTSNVNPNKLNGINAHWNYTFDKLKIWGLTQYEKLVFLDADMIVVNNIDHLFNKETFSAVCADCSYPGNETWRGGLNSGLMVIEPNKQVEKDLMAMLPNVISDFNQKQIPVGDQDVIKAYCTWWGTADHLQLDEGYNVFAHHLDYYIRDLGYSCFSGERLIYVIHFVGKVKPWMFDSFSHCLKLLYMCFWAPGYRLAYRQYRKIIRYSK